MNNWFQCRVKYMREGKNGLSQSVSETYLVDAMTFTEAEAVVMQEMEGEKEFTLQSAARSNIKEVVFYGDTAKWFKCKVTYITMDQDTERELKVTTYILVNADNIEDAWDRLQEHLKEMLVPFQVPKIEETSIVEVIEHKEGKKKKQK